MANDQMTAAARAAQVRGSERVHPHDEEVTAITSVRLNRLYRT
ncbi:hypothetical protein [Streptomyces sp. SD15]